MAATVSSRLERTARINGMIFNGMIFNEMIFNGMICWFSLLTKSGTFDTKGSSSPVELQDGQLQTLCACSRIEQVLEGKQPLQTSSLLLCTGSDLEPELSTGCECLSLHLYVNYELVSIYSPLL